MFQGLLIEQVLRLMYINYASMGWMYTSRLIKQTVFPGVRKKKKHRYTRRRDPSGEDQDGAHASTNNKVELDRGRGTRQE